jgi:gliding motility-associated lipoprotein GldD
MAVVLFLGLWGCEPALQPKPEAGLRLEYPTPTYTPITTNYPFQFEMNAFANLQQQANNTPNINYPEMKATLYLSYKPVKNNINLLLNDAYKLPSKHLQKAEEIPERLFINPEKKVYGTLFTVVGDAASQMQFFATDSTNHFLVGALYFYSKPNYDSLLPAISYLQKDITRLMETLSWKD